VLVDGHPDDEDPEYLEVLLQAIVDLSPAIPEQLGQGAFGIALELLPEG
jgi:hypothetical protein